MTRARHTRVFRFHLAYNIYIYELHALLLLLYMHQQVEH